MHTIYIKKKFVHVSFSYNLISNNILKKYSIKTITYNFFYFFVDLIFYLML